MSETQSISWSKQQLNRFFEWLPENNRLERIWILAKVDFKSRYYYNKLGILWALIKPIFEFFIYYVAFTIIFKSDVPNYALYLFLGLVLWYFFSEGTTKSIFILRTKLYLIENISFNKSDLFISSTLSVLLAFGFNFFAYFLMSIILTAPPFHWEAVAFFPLLIGLLCALIYALNLILATLSIYLKDIQHLWDMLVLAGFWLTPILYDAKLLLEHVPVLYYANPMTGILVNIRNVVLYGVTPDYFLLSLNVLSVIALLLLGIWCFSRFSHKAAEKI